METLTVMESLLNRNLGNNQLVFERFPRNSLSNQLTPVKLNFNDSLIEFIYAFCSLKI